MKAYLRGLSNRSFTDRLPAITIIYLLSLLGAIGNSLVFITYRRFQPSTSRVFVLAMSANDFAINVLGTVFGTLKYVFFYDFPSTALCAVIHASEKLFAGTAFWILTFVALDRHRRVCTSFKKQMTLSQAHYLVLVSVGMGVLVSFPFIPLFGERSVPTDLPGVTGRRCGIKNMHNNKVYEKVHEVLLFGTVLTTLVIFVVCYVSIGCHVRQAQRSLTRHSHKRSPYSSKLMSFSTSGRQQVVSGEEPQRKIDTDPEGCGAHNDYVSQNVSSKMVNVKDRRSRSDCESNFNVTACNNVLNKNPPEVNASIVSESKIISPVSVQEQPFAPETSLRNNHTSHHNCRRTSTDNPGSDLDHSKVTKLVPKVSISSSMTKSPKPFTNQSVLCSRKQAQRMSRRPSRTTLIMFILTLLIFVNFLSNVIVG